MELSWDCVYGSIHVKCTLCVFSEYGEKWHESGTMGKKQNVLDDFQAAGEYLIKEKYTSPNK